MKYQGDSLVKGKRVEVWQKIPTAAALCLGYSNENTLYRCLEAFQSEKFSGEKLLLDLGFPGNRPLKFEGWEVVRVKNQGTAKNWNVGWKMLKCPDRLLGVEPDELPDPGWAKAALSVLGDPTVGIATLTMKSHHEHYIPTVEHLTYNINNQDVVEFPVDKPTPWPISAISSRLLKHGLECRGYYGDMEAIMKLKCSKLGLKVVHLVDYVSEHLKGNDTYEAWKVHSGDGYTKETYETWLQSRLTSQV